MSKQLCFQLNEIFVPVLTKNSKLFNKISISAKELTQENYCCKNASATGFSRGVDSFDTICSLSENRTEKLSHLIFSNISSHLSTTVSILKRLQVSSPFIANLFLRISSFIKDFKDSANIVVLP